MTTQEKIIKNKLGVLELASMLGNVSKACKVIPFHQCLLQGTLMALVYPA